MDLNFNLSIARLLQSISWDWNSNSLDTLTKALGLKIHQQLTARATYKFPSGASCSFYLSPPRILFVESTLDVFFDLETLTPSAISAKEAEFIANYSTLVQGLSNDIGEPAFEGKYGSLGFPEDQNAICLAEWGGKNSRFMVQYKHEDKELPMRLCVVIYPLRDPTD